MQCTAPGRAQLARVRGARQEFAMSSMTVREREPCAYRLPHSSVHSANASSCSAQHTESVPDPKNGGSDLAELHAAALSAVTQFQHRHRGAPHSLHVKEDERHRACALGAPGDVTEIEIKCLAGQQRLVTSQSKRFTQELGAPRLPHEERLRVDDRRLHDLARREHAPGDRVDLRGPRCRASGPAANAPETGVQSQLEKPHVLKGRKTSMHGHAAKPERLHQHAS